MKAWVANYEISDYIVLHCLDQALCNRGSSIRRDLSDSDGEGRTPAPHSRGEEEEGDSPDRWKCTMPGPTDSDRPGAT